ISGGRTKTIAVPKTDSVTDTLVRLFMIDVCSVLLATMSLEIWFPNGNTWVHPFNLLLFFTLAMVCKLYDLSSSRHSLGKLSVIGFVFLLVNGVNLFLSGALLEQIALSLTPFVTMLLVLAAAHYSLGNPYSTDNPEHPFYRLERAIKRGVDL